MRNNLWEIKFYNKEIFLYFLDLDELTEAVCCNRKIRNKNTDYDDKDIYTSTTQQATCTDIFEIKKEL